MKINFGYLCAVGALAVAVRSEAAVGEADGLGSAWLGSPTFMTVTSPTLGTSGENNFVGPSGAGGSSGGLGGLGQAFVNTSAGTLNNIQLSFGGGAGFSFNIFLYDRGSAGSYTPATSSSYAPGSLTDLFTPSLAFTYNGGGGGAQNVLQLTFSGADAVSLSANELYSFDIEPTTSGAQPVWYRGGATAFTGGQAYRYAQFSAGQYGAINGAIRDFDMAVQVDPVPEPTTIALLGLGLLTGVTALRRRK